MGGGVVVAGGGGVVGEGAMVGVRNGSLVAVACPTGVTGTTEGGSPAWAIGELTIVPTRGVTGVGVLGTGVVVPEPWHPTLPIRMQKTSLLTTRE